MSQTSWMPLCLLAGRQLKRDLQSPELRVLAAALIIAVTVSTTIGYLGARLQGAMTLKVSEYLAADLRLTGAEPASAAQIALGTELGLDSAQTTEFSSVVTNEQAMQLVSIKAVDNHYPLRGVLKSTDTPNGPEQLGGVPAAGTLWIEGRLQSMLSLEIGDTLDIGKATLTIKRILTHEPDRAGDFYSLTPRILMNASDLPATGVIQPGSRVKYNLLWKGEQAALAAYQKALQSSLLPHQKLSTVQEGNRYIGTALVRAERYLNLTSLVAILLAAVAVALSANHFAARRFDYCALLRTLGMRSRQISFLFGAELALLGVLASTLGGLLGYTVQIALFSFLAPLLPQDLPGAGILPLLSGISTGLIALAGFALPPLAALHKVPALRVMQRTLAPPPPAHYLVYGAAFIALGVVMWRLSLDLKLTLGLLVGGTCAAVLIGGVVFLILHTLERYAARAPLAWRLGIGQLLKKPIPAIGQILAFGLILMCMGLIGLLRGDLLTTWHNQLPKQAANYFALNIAPSEQAAFAQTLDQYAGSRSPLYPIIQGRLTQINNQSLADRLAEKPAGARAVSRDLSLTWAADVPSDNRLVAGRWWSPVIQKIAEIEVSVEQELANNLGLALGDILTFNIAGVDKVTRITSLRSLDWSTLRPNFFVIFAPNSLDDAPTTYLTSFYVAPEQESNIIALAKQYSTVTFFSIAALLEQIRSITEQVSWAVEFILLFVLAAGFSVLLATLQATLGERMRQGALLRALGAPRALLIRLRFIEFAVLGACSGLLAACGAELVSVLLYHFVFDLRWQPHFWLWLLPFWGALLIGGVGGWGTRTVAHTSPMTLLRGNS